jgi:quercetin dioxygenase-like cupin family protein
MAFGPPPPGLPIPSVLPREGGTIYAMAGGHRVSVLTDAQQSGGSVDLIEVHALPGGGPPAHSHSFAELFVVLEGELEIEGERDGELVWMGTACAGDTAYMAPWSVHATRNRTNELTRFLVFCWPSAMAAYFADAGVQVPAIDAEPEREPAGPGQLVEIAERHGIRLWSPTPST